MYVCMYVCMYTMYLCEPENVIIVLNNECTNEPIIAGTRRVSGIGGTGLQQGAGAVPRRCIGASKLL